MSNMAENNVIRFINISKKKDGMYANFKAKGIRAGTVCTASIAVDLATIDIDPAEDPLETIIEQSAQVAVREFKKTDLRFEGLEMV